MKFIIAVFTAVYLICCVNCLTLQPDTTPSTIKPTQTPSHIINRHTSISRHKERHYEYRTVTAYCSCKICCGKSVNDKAYGITASGKKVRSGMVAADLPFGTRLKIKGKVYTVEDRLSAEYSDRIDIYMNTHQEALNFGIQKIKIEILD